MKIKSTLFCHHQFSMAWRATFAGANHQPQYQFAPSRPDCEIPGGVEIGTGRWANARPCAPGLKEKIKLTDEQRAELQPIEDDFAKTSKEYHAVNQPRIDAALEAIRQADAAKDTTQIQAARHQLQQEWAGLQSDRDAAIVRVKPLLTPAQIVILEDPKNQWHENHGDEAK